MVIWLLIPENRWTTTVGGTLVGTRLPASYRRFILAEMAPKLLKQTTRRVEQAMRRIGWR